MHKCNTVTRAFTMKSSNTAFTVWKLCYIHQKRARLVNMLVLHPRNKLLCIWIQIALDLENKYIELKKKKKKSKFITDGCGFVDSLRSIQPRSLRKKYLLENYKRLNNKVIPNPKNLWQRKNVR